MIECRVANVDERMTKPSMFAFGLMLAGFGDSILKVFWVRWTKSVRLVMHVSRLLFLMPFGLELGCLGLRHQAFGVGGIANIIFGSSWISYDSQKLFC